MPLKRPVVDEVLRARAEGRTYTSEELGDRAGQLEAKMAQLRARYEQYFLGLDRKPPSNEREAMHKELDQLRQLSTKNTALKFRLNSLFNRFLVYERLWTKTERDIEEGRYHKEIFRARLHQRRSGPAAGPAEDVDANFDDDSPSPPPPPAFRGPDAGRLRAIYDAFVAAKRECREPVQGLTFEQLAGRIRDQVPALIAQTNARAIDFKVVIKDGKATLRAVAKA